MENTYLQRQFRKKHAHRYFVDIETSDAVCLCGKVKWSPKAKKNKYHARGTVYNGYAYDSEFEANYAMQLDWRMKAKDINGIKTWERQYPVHITYKGHEILTTKVDFRILHHDGSYELVETKGFETADYKIKKKLITMMWIPDHPDHTYTVVT